MKSTEFPSKVLTDMYIKCMYVYQQNKGLYIELVLYPWFQYLTKQTQKSRTRHRFGPVWRESALLNKCMHLCI